MNHYLKQILVCLALGIAIQLNASTNHRIIVEAGNAESLLSAIAQANQQNSDSLAERLFILIPDGYYDLGQRVLTEISGHNISLVGQSMDQTIIRNAPDKAEEGISKTAVIRNTGTGTYIECLTLRNDLDYYGSNAAGRAVCLQDRGTRTICRQVRMLSYQDTYYSDNLTCQHYFSESEIHGTIDFICGAGDVYFDHCTLVAEPRTLDGKGRDVIAAPRTDQTPWGYVFESCTIRSEKSDFHYGRGWHTKPRMALLNTTLLSPEKLATTRYDSQGMRTVESLFYEYHTMDATGSDITPHTNVVTFTLGDQRREHETILTKEEASRYRLENIFPDWRPEILMSSISAQAGKMKTEAWPKR